MQPSYPIRSQCFPCIPLKMFRGYKKGTFGRNGLNKIHNKTSLRHAIVHEKIPEDSKKKNCYLVKIKDMHYCKKTEILFHENLV